MDMLSDPWLSSRQPGLLSVHPAVHTPSEDDPRGPSWGSPCSMWVFLNDNAASL